MVKFSLFSQGLSNDVRERHDRYLKSPLRMKAMLICSLLDIPNLKITDVILERCKVLKDAYYIDWAALYQSSEDTQLFRERLITCFLWNIISVRLCHLTLFFWIILLKGLPKS